MAAAGIGKPRNRFRSSSDGNGSKFNAPNLAELLKNIYNNCSTSAPSSSQRPFLTTTTAFKPASKKNEQGGKTTNKKGPKNKTGSGESINTSGSKEIAGLENSQVSSGKDDDDNDVDDGLGDDADYDADHAAHKQGGRHEGDGGRGGGLQGFRCQPISGKHSEYIRQHLKKLQAQCRQFSACTQELYSAENYHRILAGENTRLTNICGLMYANGGGHYTTLREECSGEERRAIRQTIGQRLGEELAGRPLVNTLKKLHRCIEDEKQDNEEAIDTVCRLKNHTRSEILCGDEQVNRDTRSFFNQELENLHCSCVAIDQAGRGRGGPKLPQSARIAIAASVIGLLLILVIAVVILCFRQRKTKRKLKEHRRNVAYNREDHSPHYQEIPPPWLQATTKPPTLRQPSKGTHHPEEDKPDVPPPLPPERFPKVPQRFLHDFKHRTPSDDDDDRPHSYLEPLPDPLPGNSGEGTLKSRGAVHGKTNQTYSLATNDVEPNPGSPYSLAKQVDESNGSPSGDYILARRMDGSTRSPAKGSVSEGTYFDTLKLAKHRGSEDEFGYSKLRGPPGRGSTERESSVPEEGEYFELEAQMELKRVDSENASEDLISSTKL